MRLAERLRRHRALAAFAAGALLTLVALAAVGYLVLAHQRRSARVLALALSRALAREVRIDRVTDLGTQRVVMRGVRLPRAGGWAAEMTAEQVEVTGPLLAAARGHETPLSLVVTRPTVEAERGGPAGLVALDGLREGLAGLLGASTHLDLALTGGVARYGGAGVEFDLVLRKGREGATAELTLRSGAGVPLVLTADARMEGPTARVRLTGRGELGPVAGWLPASAGALAARPLSLTLDVGLAATASVSARGGLALGDALRVDGEGTLRDGTLRVASAHLDVDLGVAGALAGLGWRPAGRAELSDVTVTWRPEGETPPTAGASLRVERLVLPAAGVGTDVVAEGVGARLTLEPAGSGLVARGEARADRLGVAGLDVVPAAARYRLSLTGRGAVSRADLDGLVLRVAGAALGGSLGWDVADNRLDARLDGESVEAAELIRHLAPGWLGDTDRVRASGLRVTARGLEPAGLQAGTVGLEARGLAIMRPDGEVSSGRVAARAILGGGGLAASAEAEGLSGALPLFRGVVPRLVASADLSRSPAGALELAGATLAARDREGGELLVAELRPASPPAPGRRVLTVRAADLDRLRGLWPDVERRVSGSARLDLELTGPGLAAADGRLALRVSEAELLGGRVSLREVVADLPLRRGAEAAGPPPWGRLEVGELIGYGLVVRDLATPARVFRDRLSLNELSYALYSGEGQGWAEVEVEATGPFVRGHLTGERLRIEEFMGAYGIRGGTMTGLLRYDLDAQYRAGRLGVKGRFEVPEGGAVNIELLNRLLAHTPSDPAGVVRRALENLRRFDYKLAVADVRTSGSDGGEILVSLSLKGRELFWIFPARVPEISVHDMPISALARQFPGR